VKTVEEVESLLQEERSKREELESWKSRLLALTEEQVVEAAAQALRARLVSETEHTNFPRPWDELEEPTRRSYREDVRALLTILLAPAQARIESLEAELAALGGSDA